MRHARTLLQPLPATCSPHLPTSQVPVVVTEQERRVETAGVDTCTSEEVCGQKVFTEVEDRPVVRERVERIVEHRPVEKQVCVCVLYGWKGDIGWDTWQEEELQEREGAEEGVHCRAGPRAWTHRLVLTGCP